MFHDLSVENAAGRFLFREIREISSSGITAIIFLIRRAQRFVNEAEAARGVARVSRGE